MRFPVYSLRTGILTQLTFLIVAAMLLINVVTVKFSERDLIRTKVQTGRTLLHALEQYAGLLSTPQRRGAGGSIADPRFEGRVARLLEGSGFTGLTIVGRLGNPVVSFGTSGTTDRTDLLSARKALETGTGGIDYQGTTWGVIWLNNKEIRVSAPLYFEGRPTGGMCLRGSLVPVYQTLRKTQKIIFLYIVLDTLVLVLVGVYLLSRIVVKPIHRLLKMTEAYKEGETIPSFAEESPNEIGELSRSMNVMLRRLSENKIELKAHIVSLEKANKELQQAQREIVRSEKMASVGRLAAGIAHEIGNPIGIILGYLELLDKAHITNEEREDFLGRIKTEITRINKIIRQLLDFSRPSGGEPVRCGAHDIVRDTVNILALQSMMEKVRVILALEASEDEILADPNQLQQVFLNIIMNAADALSAGGGWDPGEGEKTLTIESRNGDDAIEMAFADNGPGIPEKDLVHVFDPFYTTKEPGKGTGLGLSVCYQIVEGLGGTMEAESGPGKGTRVTVTLPLSRPESRG